MFRPRLTWPLWIHSFGELVIWHYLKVNVILIWHRLRHNFSRLVLKSWTIKISWWLTVSEVCKIETFLSFTLPTFSLCQNWHFFFVYSFCVCAHSFFIALQAYEVMHDAACLIDPTTNSYCYLSAVQNPNPSDLYFYSLPLGITLPNTSKPSCSACSKSVMGVYAIALQDPTESRQLVGLRSSYQVSVEVAAQFCGSSFALSPVSSGAIGMASLYCYRGWRTVFTTFIFGFIWTIFAYFSWYIIYIYQSNFFFF